MRRVKLALIQLAVGLEKKLNLEKAACKVKEAASTGAQIIALPECFNSPYGTNYFEKYAETIPGESTEKLSKMARDNEVYLVGGSIPEKDGNKIFNTCTVWGPQGQLLAKHRKIHLFDIDVPGSIKFTESDILSPGNSFTTFDHPFGKVGIGICYDMRFAEMAQIYNKMDCKLLIYPGAFNMTTGPVHWELMQRGRALDNQVYVASVSPARDVSASYIAWGHSTIVNPWGEVIATTEHEEAIVHAELDLDFFEKTRQMVPLPMQRRYDLYDVVRKN